MHGNAWEWCYDYYEEDYYKQPPEPNPTGPAQGVFNVSRVFRGGSWRFFSRITRSAFRGSDVADNRDLNNGFRLVRELDDSAHSEQPKEPPAQPVPADLLIIELPIITNTIGMKFNEIPTGTFMMGSPETEKDRDDDENQHKITITKAFYMQTTEVTQAQWKAVMGTEPWKEKQYVKEGPNYAASFVSWDDSVAFCIKLSEKEGKTYRLPTEAEWEYACRAGTQTAWSFGNDEKALGDYAWYAENADEIGETYAHQVGLKKPNAFGLYDMHGNVLEWCNDYYERNYYKQSPEKDPTGPTSGDSYRVSRGGSWFSPTRYTLSAGRGRHVVFSQFHSSGFRVVRELD
jgi:formylglycine-generating enzyme required for sulfatase activity